MVKLIHIEATFRRTPCVPITQIFNKWFLPKFHYHWNFSNNTVVKLIFAAKCQPLHFSMKLLVCNYLGKWKCSIVIPLCQRIGRAHEWCSFTLCPVGTHSRISHGQISDWGLPNICSPKNTVLILKRLVKLPLFVFRQKQKTVESGKKMWNLERKWKSTGNGCIDLEMGA